MDNAARRCVALTSAQHQLMLCAFSQSARGAMVHHSSSHYLLYPAPRNRRRTLLLSVTEAPTADDQRLRILTSLIPQQVQHIFINNKNRYDSWASGLQDNNSDNNKGLTQLTVVDG
jgi:hypothetical protein